MTRLAGVLMTVAGVLASLVESRAVAACPDPEGADACIEECRLDMARDEKPGALLLSKLKDLAATGHHVNTNLRPAQVKRESEFRVAPFHFTSREAQAWELNGRYAGPCSGLVAVFTSVAVDDRNPRDVVDIYELRYRTQAAAKRVASLLTEPTWDWNYHPYGSVHDGRSVIVIEGRHRAWSAFRRVAEHFGWRRPAPRGRLTRRRGEHAIADPIW
jgi:hypothetical protein